MEHNLCYYTLFLKTSFWRCDHRLNILNTFCNAQFLTCLLHRIVLITSRLFCRVVLYIRGRTREGVMM